MEIFSLPSYLNFDDSSEVQLCDYINYNDNYKSKVDLTFNTFSFLQEGVKEVISDYKTVSIKKSKFLIIKSGHCLMTERLANKSKKYRSVLLFFSDNALFDFYNKYNIEQLNSKSSRHLRIEEYDSFIRSFVKSLEEIEKLKGEARPALLKIKFEEIMLYLAKTKGAKYLSFLLEKKGTELRNLVQVVENNKLNKLTLKELAFLANRSVSAFKRDFEKEYGESPIKWFKDKRLEHAAFLLEVKSKRASEIFEEVGYETLSNFIQAFKVKYGQTPKQYQGKN